MTNSDRSPRTLRPAIFYALVAFAAVVAHAAFMIALVEFDATDPMWLFPQVGLTAVTMAVVWFCSRRYS